ncbi:DUF4174 domain-containing protein [Mycobacterium sp. SMC-4]|uniref:DUF4174 domain-containing protein n=1 Tax=Mycobacterium sp. SMC-4 TaxID=2857059 RepID=UPI0021B36F89|nr:DUF4174 domain-containing protein [Mycobacterium sp. SMC-4]
MKRSRGQAQPGCAVVRDGNSSLDGHTMDAAEAQRLVARYAIDTEGFTALLIGKDGGEKRRIDGVPDLRAIYAVIDGMPMRSSEMNSAASRC